ncbi:unnamed protein product [Cylicocyclus nassatus]|uniref:SCP domain-containing protein n=1 Tax=Cylicocyclus nassatus TaxID=53992 RepID=A0AA36GSW2_CYLNA|nr:unnamed protein product [Cylicocyclus nassatus]
MRSILLVCLIATAYAGICPSNGGMNDQIRQKFLDVHNELRSLVANGKAKDGYGDYAPRAAAMNKLHSNTKGLGENIYMSSAAYDPVKAAEDASRSWFGELAQKGVGKDLTFSMKLFNNHVGHYTQMVWQSTKVIGCAVQSCPKMSLAVCNYKEAGNMLNAKIYETGTPCSKCPGGCSEGLCVV